MKSICLLSLCIPIILLSQTFENLELVLEIPDPDSAPGGFGIGLACGDFNSDGYNDIVITKHSRVYVYYGDITMDNQPDVIWGADPQCATYAATGNINGDEYVDIVIGRGYTYLYYGGNPMDTVPALQFSAGSSVSCGDLNGDRYDDIIVGRPSINDYIGEVRIFWGGSNPDTMPDVILNGDPVARNNFGDRLSSGKDVNNDGYEDLFVAGNWGFLGALAACYIYYGGNPMDTIPDVIMHPPQGGFFGDAIALVPDLEGDEYDDAVVGIPDYNPDKDKTFVYCGGDPMDNILDLLLYEGAGGAFGYSVAGCFADNDVYGDLLVGAPGKGETYGGIMYLYRGDSVIDTISDARIVGDNYQNIGWQVASAGDIDGDGIEEIMVSNYAAVYAPRKVWVVRYTGTGIEEDGIDSTIIRLIKAYPNPFTDLTKIEYQLGCYVTLSLKVYDVTGRLVKTLVNCRQNPGLYRARWDGRDSNNKMVSAGVYFCELEAGNYRETKMLIFLGN